MITPLLSTFLQVASRPFKWWVTIAEWEQGVRVRLGKNTKLLVSGIHFRIPFLDRIFVQTTRTQLLNTDSLTASTKDLKAITFAVGIRFNIKDVKAMYNAFSDLGGALAQDATALIASFISQSNFADLSPVKIEEHVAQNMKGYAFLDDLQVRILSFCAVRTFRLISGGSWIPCGRGLDHADESGERT